MVVVVIECKKKWRRRKISQNMQKTRRKRKRIKRVMVPILSKIYKWSLL